MRHIKLSRKTGFKVRDKFLPINIRDTRGILFYTTEDILPKVEYFNLPEGDYFVDSGDFIEVDKPREYELAKLPPPERDFGSLKDFVIKFGDNPHKCTVDWIDKTIEFDYQFLEKPLPEVMFILYHEEGHRYYETEEYCDLYASNLMKIRGYNPTQIARAQMFSLSSNQTPRKEFVVNHLINTL